MIAPPAFDCTPAELVVLVYHLTGGAVPLDEQAEALFAAEGRGAAEIEERLEARGLLIRLPFEESIGVAGEVAALLRATLDPERLLHLRLREGEGERVSAFSLAEGEWVRHDASEASHRLALVGDEGALLDALVATATAAGRRVALLLRVESPTAPESSAASLGWLAADGRLWLLDAGSGGELRPLTPAELRAALADFLSA